MSKLLIRAVSGAALCCAFGSTFAVTLRVPQDFPTVQGAVDAAPPGATVLVAPGTYRENLVIGKSLVLKSRGGARVTVLDGQGIGPVVVAIGTGSESVEVSGFTVTNGLNNFGLIPAPGAGNAGGIQMSSVTGVVTDNVIRNNRGCFGSGVSASSSAMTIQRNQILDNAQDPSCDGADGGGIFLNVGGATGSLVANNIISGNRTGGRGAGLYVQAMPDVTIRDNLFSGNDASSPGGGSGGGIVINLASATITGNALIGNSAQSGGAMALLPVDNGNLVSAQGNLMLDNTASFGSAIDVVTFSEQSLHLVKNVVKGSTESGLVRCDGTGFTVAPSNLLYNAAGPELDGACDSR